MKRLLLLPLLVLAACDKKPKAAPKPPESKPAAQAPAFEPGPAPNRTKGGGYFRIDEAMTIADVDFLLRTSTPEAEVLKEIAERGFVAQVTPAQANALAASGASPRLIALVQDQRYVLTPPEQAERASRQQARGRGLPADRKQREKEFEERQQKIHAQQATPAASPKPVDNSVAGQASRYLQQPKAVKEQLNRANEHRNSE